MVNYFSEDVDFNLVSESDHTDWIEAVAASEQSDIEELTYIFCSDSYLLKLNQDYLDHNTFTDIVTFGYSESNSAIEGDIFISIDRIKENASKYETSFDNELRRVMAHGLLHLIGYKDKSSEEKEEMRKKEDACLTLWKN